MDYKHLHILSLIIIFLGSELRAADNKTDFRVDSLFNISTPEHRVSKTVWVKGEEPGYVFETALHFNARGVYLEHPVPFPDSLDSQMSLAIKFSDELNGLLPDDLPEVTSTFSIADERLMNSYSQVFRSEMMRHNVDIIIISSEDTTSTLYQIGQRLRKSDPDFFRMDYEYAMDPSDKRSEFISETTEAAGIIIDYQDIDEYKRILKKEIKNADHLTRAFEDYARWLLLPQEDIQISAKLKHQLWKQMVVPFRKSSGSLPLNTQVIGLWVEDERSHLKAGLKQYFPTILNLKYDQIPSGVPVVIDSRDNPMLAAEFAFNFQADHPVIWVGQFGQVMNVNAEAYLLSDASTETLDSILPEMIYGSEGVPGQPKPNLPEFLTVYLSDPVQSQHKLGVATPEWVDMNSQVLDSIDILAAEMVREYGTPGGQVLVAKEGKIIFSKAYGFLTYDSLIEVTENTLYDLASLTKVNSTLMATMKLVDEGRLNLDSTLGFYLPEYLGTNKEDIKLRNLLSHQAGLPSYIPFWKRSLKGDFIEIFYYKSEEAEANDQRSYGYTPDPILLDSLQNWIKLSNVSEKDNPGYKYSDIGFMILHQVIEKTIGESIETFVNRHFYRLLNMPRTHFNPLNKGYEIHEIAPTEYDYHFREEQVWGNVHDRNAAIFGGVAGHAGLFSNSRDLAIMLQMLLHDGNYGGRKYFSPQTIAEFNQTQFDGNRRGLGWDKPGKFNPNISAEASSSSFGHTGFTGTMVWADPEHELIFVFLSNRIFPNAENKNLIRLDSRRKMQDIIYRSMISKNQTEQTYTLR